MTLHGDRGWNRTNVAIDINPFITHPAHERLHHTTGVHTPYSLQTAVCVLLYPTRIKTVKELWDEPTVFCHYLRRLECLPVTICRCDNQRQNILLSYFKTLSVGQAGVWTHDLWGVLPSATPKGRIFAPFGLKTGIHISHFGLELGVVFERTSGVYERICRFNPKWIRKKE